MAVWGRTPGGAFGVLAVSAVVFFAGLAAPAGAHHIPGATYTSPSTTGVWVTFTVWADGSGINTATLKTETDSYVNLCPGFGGVTSFYGDSLPIIDHSFSDPDVDGPIVFGPDMAWQGSFSGPQSVSGTITSTQCTPQTLSWSATTTSPPPPERCVVPNVKRRLVPAAKRAIVNADCRVGRIGRAFSARVARRRIISQTPRAGAQRPEGAEVNLVVSKGRRR